MIFVMIGGALGSISRYLISILFTNKSSVFPWGTLTVNLIGSFLLGIAVATLANEEYLLLGIGFLGAFTTFSSFSTESMDMLRQRRYGTTIFYISSSLIGVLIFFYLGHLLVG